MRIPFLLTLFLVGHASAFSASVDVQVDDTHFGESIALEGSEQGSSSDDGEEVRVWFYNNTAILVRYETQTIYEDEQTLKENPLILVELEERICRVASINWNDFTRSYIDPDYCWTPIVYSIIRG